ncbi:MAG: hypothetical protein KDI62_28545 [Anaerolineae bacterium]|nr:hypothetical protein [Anaerolineae bacterium]MCB9102490.1 hypothetical protein [Anaerolineales bacterium]MCB9104813.1 hypothetical protein [Anaerolineales bacterium]
MSAELILKRLRLFLLGLAIFIFAGTVIELWFTNHMESAIQLIPFGLAGLGILAIGAALIAPQRATLLGLRVVMGLVALGSCFGIYEHIEHNLAFELDIRPNATVAQVFLDALGGTSPLLAPGILALAAILVLAATYYHPGFKRQ